MLSGPIFNMLNFTVTRGVIGSWDTNVCIVSLLNSQNHLSIFVVWAFPHVLVELQCYSYIITAH